MGRIVDFHTHAFPDQLAGRAMEKLEAAGGIKPHLDGTIAGLLSSMDRAGIERSVVCSIATRPGQFEPILAWSRQIRSERIIPFPSVHPDDPAAAERPARVKAEGFAGLKLHPYYQDFFLDEERLFPLYEAVDQAGLILVVHTGFDFAFPRIERADPARVARVLERFPSLKLVVTHLGAWDQWEKIEGSLLGRPVYMETSFSLECLSVEAARGLISKHPSRYLLFGTDSPWTDQTGALDLFRRLGLPAEDRELILRGNAERLLESVSGSPTRF